MKGYLSTVKANRIVDEGVHVIELEVPGFDGIGEAGQFVMVKAEKGYDPFLRRPYSIFDCDKESMKLLVKIVGKGSEYIALKPVDSAVEFFGPLGTSFPIKEQGYHLLVAGGMGIAPLWFLAGKLEHAGIGYSLVFGERKRSKIGSMVENRFKNVLFVTDDGSYGVKGFATDAVSSFIDEHAIEEITVYGCGPPSMLGRLVEIANEKKVLTYISLEERMACGVGVCLGCSVKKSDGSGYTTVCKDGPVFPAQEVTW